MVDTASDKLMKSLKENWTTIMQDGDDGKFIRFSTNTTPNFD